MPPRNPASPLCRATDPAITLMNLVLRTLLATIFIAFAPLLADSAASGVTPENVALSSRGAVAYDNGSFDDYGFDYDAALTIDGVDSGQSYWAGRDYVHPQQMWVLFDRTYLISEVSINERSDAYMNTGSIEYLVAGSWVTISSINKSSSDYSISFAGFAADGVRISVNTSTSPSGWYNKVACFFTITVMGVDCTGSPFCFGDASGSTCQCASGGSDAGCANSVGSGAVLEATGCAAFIDDTFGLSVSGLPAEVPGLCVAGASQANGGNGNPIGAGLLCVSPYIRSQVIVSDATGALSIDSWRGQPFGSYPGGAVVGSPTYYQWWYRDQAGACSSETRFNFSNAWQVTWL
jgi:hypothetical protein